MLGCPVAEASLRKAMPIKASPTAAPGHARPAAAAESVPARKRDARKAERRDAILAAALEEFCISGFAATRLDDVARRAGVAKGTIYLHFRDKEALFQELVVAMLVPVVGAIEGTPPPNAPTRLVLRGIVDLFIREIYMTERRHLLRLMMTEGPRFPALAEFYYRNVVERALAALRGLMLRAHQRGELADDSLARFPQLVVAPAITAIVWSGLFDKFSPLDITALMHAHLDLLFGQGRSP
jgi:AcrR family transcriptional regulator